LLKLPPDSVLDAFAKLKDDNLSDEQAFIKLMTAYDERQGRMSVMACS
jgi:hypothetical protein